MKKIITIEEMNEIKKAGTITIDFPTNEKPVLISFLMSVIEKLLKENEGDINIPLETFAEFLEVSVPTICQYMKKLTNLKFIETYRKGLPGRTYIVNKYNPTQEDE